MPASYGMKSYVGNSILKMQQLQQQVISRGEESRRGEDERGRGDCVWVGGGGGLLKKHPTGAKSKWTPLLIENFN